MRKILYFFYVKFYILTFSYESIDFCTWTGYVPTLFFYFFAALLGKFVKYNYSSNSWNDFIPQIRGIIQKSSRERDESHLQLHLRYVV